MQKRKKTDSSGHSVNFTQMYILIVRYKTKGGLPIYIVHVSTLNDHVVSQYNRNELSLA